MPNGFQWWRHTVPTSSGTKPGDADNAAWSWRGTVVEPFAVGGHSLTSKGIWPAFIFVRSQNWFKWTRIPGFYWDHVWLLSVVNVLVIVQWSTFRASNIIWWDLVEKSFGRDPEILEIYHRAESKGREMNGHSMRVLQRTDRTTEFRSFILTFFGTDWHAE